MKQYAIIGKDQPCVSRLKGYAARGGCNLRTNNSSYLTKGSHLQGENQERCAQVFVYVSAGDRAGMCLLLSIGAADNHYPSATLAFDVNRKHLRRMLRALFVQTRWI